MVSSASLKIQELVDERLSSPKNHDVYEPRLTAKPPADGYETVPRCIYFHYVRIDRNGKVRVDHYLYVKRNATGASEEIPHQDVPGLIYDLALNARPRTRIKNPKKLKSSNFENNLWEYRCYIAIFFDEGNWSFHRRSNGKSAVVFDDRLGKANNSFFDACDVVLDMPKYRGGTDKRSAIYFINHVKDENGNPLGKGKKQDFKFDMWLDAQFANSSMTAMIVNFDPGGTNMGPPIDP